jgi:hypothetical protein
VLNDIIYDLEQWKWLIPRLRKYRRRRITVVVGVICRAPELFDRIFLFRKSMFEMFGYARFPTRADFDTYMDEMGRAPFLVWGV